MDKRTFPNEVLLEEAAGLLNEGREVCFTPKGNSMLPFIRGGKDSVVLKKLPTVSVGDIVLVRLPGRYVLHRVVAINNEELTLMGDGNIRGTEQGSLPDVMGTVTSIRKGERNVVPGKGRLWRAIKPLRRYILALYRRLI